MGADFSRAFKTRIFGLLGGSGALLGTPGGNCLGQNLELLNFDPRRQVRGVFTSFLGARLNSGVKTLIFGLFVCSGVSGHLGYPRGYLQTGVSQMGIIVALGLQLKS